MPILIGNSAGQARPNPGLTGSKTLTSSWGSTLNITGYSMWVGNVNNQARPVIGMWVGNASNQARPIEIPFQGGITNNGGSFSNYNGLDGKQPTTDTDFNGRVRMTLASWNKTTYLVDTDTKDPDGSWPAQGSGNGTLTYNFNSISLSLGFSWSSTGTNCRYQRISLTSAPTGATTTDVTGAASFSWSGITVPNFSTSIIQAYIYPIFTVQWI